jgi:hypothetical protein
MSAVLLDYQYNRLTNTEISIFALKTNYKNNENSLNSAFGKKKFLTYFINHNIFIIIYKLLACYPNFGIFSTSLLLNKQYFYYFIK